MEKGRRSFLKNCLVDILRETVSGFNAGVQESTDRQMLDDFFESYESSYALTLNYPDDILLETARMEGIETEGREKIDIVRDMMSKKENT